MNAEEYLENNFGITFTKSKDEFHNEIMADWLKSMDDYADYKLKSKVEAISDEKAKSLDTYIRAKHNQEECIGFIDGFEKAIELLKQ